MVRTSGSSTPSIQPSSAALAPRCSHDSRSRRRASATSRSRSTRLTSQMLGGIPCSTSIPPRAAPRCRSRRAIRAAASSRPPRDPGRGVDAVGDRVIGTSSGSKPGHSPANICPADDPVQLADAVGALRQPQAHDRHVEHVRVAALVVLGAEGEDPLDRHAGPTALSPPKYCATSSTGEPVDAGRHGVCVVKTVPARTASRASSKSGRVLDQLADPLQPEEAGVALVGVEDLGLGRPVSGTRRAGPARRRCRAASPAAAGARCRRRTAGR
jgi:hypothetical protein